MYVCFVQVMIIPISSVFLLLIHIDAYDYIRQSCIVSITITGYNPVGSHSLCTSHNAGGSSAPFTPHLFILLSIGVAKRERLPIRCGT